MSVDLPVSYASTDPALDWVPLDFDGASLSDTIDLLRPIRAIRADVAGNVTVITRGGTRNMKFAAGETRTVVATRVKLSGTTATGLEGAI